MTDTTALIHTMVMEYKQITWIDRVNPKRYWVSSEGDIYSNYNGWRKLAVTLNKNGYRYTHLAIGEKSITKKISRIVATAFLPNTKNLPEVDHINGIKTDDRVENLEWVTRKENMTRAWENNMIKLPFHTKPYQFTNKETNEVLYFRSITKAAEHFKISRQTMRVAVHRAENNKDFAYRKKYLIRKLPELSGYLTNNRERVIL